MYATDTLGKHKCLIAVISTAPIAVLKYFGHGNLGDFFTIAKDAELGFTRENLFTAYQTGLATFKSDAIIVENFLHKGLFTHFCGLFCYLLHAAAKIGKIELALYHYRIGF